MKQLMKLLNKVRKKAPLDPTLHFVSKEYQLHNIARLKHLDTLGLDLNNKKVIEFGAGIGDHTLFYLLKNCEVLSTDARSELLSIIEKRFGNSTLKIDVENDLELIKSLPKYDIIHCYGLLYHISNPEEFLTTLKGAGSLLILETCVSSDFKPVANYVIQEDKNNPTQAYTGNGSRPSREWIFSLLLKLFPYVYIPKTQPDHPEFPKDWTKDYPTDKDLIRAIFIASEIKLDLPTLTTNLPKIYL